MGELLGARVNDGEPIRQQHGQPLGQRQPAAELLQVTVGLGDDQVTTDAPFPD